MDQSSTIALIDCEYCQLRPNSERRSDYNLSLFCLKSVRVSAFFLVFLASISLFAIFLVHYQRVSEESALSRVPRLDDVTSQKTRTSDTDEEAPETMKSFRRQTKQLQDPDHLIVKRSPSISSKVRSKKMPLRSFKHEVLRAKSYEDIKKLIKRSGLFFDDLCRSRPKAAPPGGRSRRRSQGTGNCSLKNVTVKGPSSLESKGIQIRICGPHNDTIVNKKLDEYTERYSDGIRKMVKQGLCRPVDLVIDLQPFKEVDAVEQQTLAVVRKCLPIFNPLTDQEGSPPPVCSASESVIKTVPFRGSGGVIRVYKVTDEVKCRLETGKMEPKVKTRKPKKPKCPWPFKRKKRSDSCTCKTRRKGSPGYLVYRACLRVQNGYWSLQDKHKQCIQSRLCREPVCNTALSYDRDRGRCIRAQSSRQLHSAPNAVPDRLLSDSVCNCTEHGTSVASRAVPSDDRTMPNT